ncbi:9582_t:CDS:1, partial [Cetraspora pellucida]
MSVDQKNKYHDINLDLSSDENNSHDSASHNQSEQDELQSITSLSPVSTKKHDSS